MTEMSAIKERKKERNRVNFFLEIEEKVYAYWFESNKGHRCEGIEAFKWDLNSSVVLKVFFNTSS